MKQIKLKKLLKEMGYETKDYFRCLAITIGKYDNLLDIGFRMNMELDALEAECTDDFRGNVIQKGKLVYWPNVKA